MLGILNGSRSNGSDESITGLMVYRGHLGCCREISCGEKLTRKRSELAISAKEERSLGVTGCRGKGAIRLTSFFYESEGHLLR